MPNQLQLDATLVVHILGVIGFLGAALALAVAWCVSGPPDHLVEVHGVPELRGTE